MHKPLLVLLLNLRFCINLNESSVESIRGFAEREKIPISYKINDIQFGDLKVQKTHLNKTSGQLSNTMIDIKSCEWFKEWSSRLEGQYECNNAEEYKDCAGYTFNFDYTATMEKPPHKTDSDAQAYPLNNQLISRVMGSLSQINHSMLCVGIKSKQSNDIIFAIIIFRIAPIADYNTQKQELTSLIRQSSIKPIEVNKRSNLDGIASISYPKYEMAKSIIPSPQSSTNELKISDEPLLYNSVFKYLIYFTSNEFDDSLIKKDKAEYALFLRQLDEYFNLVITFDVPLIVKLITVLDYKDFTYKLLFRLFAANTEAFEKIGLRIDNISSIPFIYKGQPIRFSISSNMFTTNLCTQPFGRKCPQNSFCYQFNAEAYCLCKPGFAISDRICVSTGTTISPKGDSFGLFFIYKIFFFPFQNNSTWLIGTFIALGLAICLSLSLFYMIIRRILARRSVKASCLNRAPLRRCNYTSTGIHNVTDAIEDITAAIGNAATGFTHNITGTAGNNIIGVSNNTGGFSNANPLLSGGWSL